MLLLKMFFYITLPLYFWNGLFASELGVPSLNEEKKITKAYIQEELSPALLHNKALKQLSSKDKTLSIILFRKNFYQNLFFPSYLALKSLKAEVSLSPFIWQISSLFFAILSLVWLLFSLKQALNFKKNFKILTLWFCGLTILFASGFFNLKKRATNLKKLELLNAPFENALSLGQIEKGSDLIFLNQQGVWLQVKTSQQLKGWLLKADLIKTSE